MHDLRRDERDRGCDRQPSDCVNHRATYELAGQAIWASRVNVSFTSTVSLAHLGAAPVGDVSDGWSTSPPQATEYKGFEAIRHAPALLAEIWPLRGNCLRVGTKIRQARFKPIYESLLHPTR